MRYAEAKRIVEAAMEVDGGCADCVGLVLTGLCERLPEVGWIRAANEVDEQERVWELLTEVDGTVRVVVAGS